MVSKLPITSGAIFIEGAEDVRVQHNTLTRLDGNGVFVSGYTRNVSITDNEFSWIGCNPMASWGYTDENDGTDGQQPRWTRVLRNYVREWGHYEKQSSMWSNNKACLVEVEGNIVSQSARKSHPICTVCFRTMGTLETMHD